VSFTGFLVRLVVDRRVSVWRSDSSMTAVNDFPMSWAKCLVDLSKWSTSRIVVRMQQSVSICQMSCRLNAELIARTWSRFDQPATERLRKRITLLERWQERRYDGQ